MLHSSTDLAGSTGGYDSSGGNSIVIQHAAHAVCTGYAHLKTGSLHVGPGDSVRMGQQIAVSSNTGFSNGSHLHFEVIPGVTGVLAGNGSQNHDPAQWIDDTLTPTIEGIEEMFIVRDVADGGTYLVTANGRYHFTTSAHVTLFQRLCNDRAAGKVSQFNQLQIDQVRSIVNACT